MTHNGAMTFPVNLEEDDSMALEGLAAKLEVTVDELSTMLGLPL